ncbi:MAG: BBP7 family outer membrane beta-barrel protein [Planctomycetaceae bacterium]
MNPLRRFALAVALGACSLGVADAQAQMPGPAGMPPMPAGMAPPPTGAYAEPMLYDGPPLGYGDPGFSAYRTPQPLEGVQRPMSGWDVEVPDDGTMVGHPKLFAGSGFVRVEYLNYNIRNPGDVLMGAPLADNAYPTDPFVIFAPGTFSPTYYGIVPSTKMFDLRDNNGIKTTLGFDLAHGDSVELSAFFLAQKKSGYINNDLGISLVDIGGFLFELPNVYATSMLLDGQVGNTLYVYNDGYAAFYQSQVWGAEANYLHDLDTYGAVHFRPMIGARFLNINERMSQYGRFQQLAPVPSFETSIESDTQNYLGGGQIGARVEMVTHLFDFGAEAKWLMLANSMYADVATNNLRFNGDPYVLTSDNTTSVSTGFDLTGWATLHLGPKFDLRIGYNFLWLTGITRPEDNIYYNENGVTQPAGVVVDMKKHDWSMSGLQLGGTIKW